MFQGDVVLSRIFYWILLILIIGTFCYLVSDVLAPFLISFVFAYILQPLIERNTARYSLSRSIISLFVFCVFVSGFVLIVLVITPIIYQQFSLFVVKIPKYKASFQENITLLTDHINSFDPDAADKIAEISRSAINSMFSVVTSFANHIWDYTIATINVFALVALVPIILYYFMRDWGKIVSALESLMPEHGKNKMREIFISINELLSGYIRGQLNICLILSVYYVIGLSLIGIDLALLLGLLSGFLIIIPFIGAIASFILASLSCYVTFGFGYEFIYMTILYVIGHTVEGYILAPKIIGNKIGLHPVWIIFAVFAAGSLFGFVGILFAIPLAGIVKVLVLQFLDYYKTTSFYRGR